jgi:hypothetical protein
MSLTTDYARSGAMFLTSHLLVVRRPYEQPSGVYHCEIQLAPDRMFCDVDFHAAPGGDRFPAYYLRYDDNKTTSVTLNANMLGTDVKHFLTPSLNGCTVCITGPLHSPTVYHANAKELTGPEYPAEAAQQHMNATLPDKGVRLAKPQYNIQADQACDWLIAQRRAKAAQAERPLPNEELGLDPKVTVVGFADNGKWRFWYQHWASFLVEEKQKWKYVSIVQLADLYPKGVRTVSGYCPGVCQRERAEWVPDERAPTCRGCNEPFTWYRRRHHCRQCGQIFCDGCSSHTKVVKLPVQEPGKPAVGKSNGLVRVCDDCFKHR